MLFRSPRAGELSLATIVAALTTGPAQLLRCAQPEIAPGSPASLVEVDLAATWRPSRATLFGRSINTPLLGRELPGVVRTRRLCSIAGWAKHGVFYEFTSLEMRNAHFLPHEDAHPEIKAYSDVMVQKLTHAPASSTLATRLWPPVAAAAATA